MMGYEGGDLLLTGAVWPTVRSLLRPVCAGCGWWPGWPAALVSDERALEAEERRTTGLTAGLTAYATMRYTNRRSLPFTFFRVMITWTAPASSRVVVVLVTIVLILTIFYDMKEKKVK